MRNECLKLIGDGKMPIILSEKEKAIECIKALSRIEGATMAMSGLTNREVFTHNIDVIMKYFEELLKELKDERD